MGFSISWACTYTVHVQCRSNLCICCILCNLLVYFCNLVVHVRTCMCISVISQYTMCVIIVHYISPITDPLQEQSSSSTRPRCVHVHDKYSDTWERQSKDIQIKSQEPFKEKLLPRVGLEPMTFSVLGWSSTNWATEAAQLAEFKSPIQTNTIQGKATCTCTCTCIYRHVYTTL